MSDVEFNPGQTDYSSSFSGGRPTMPGGTLTKLTMRLTGIEDEAQVNKILLGVAGLFFIASALILIFYL